MIFIDNESIIRELRLFECVLLDLLACLQGLQDEFIPFICVNAKSHQLLHGGPSTAACIYDFWKLLQP